jgi:hypothetical protein
MDIGTAMIAALGRVVVGLSAPSAEDEAEDGDAAEGKRAEGEEVMLSTAYGLAKGHWEG